MASHIFPLCLRRCTFLARNSSSNVRIENSGHAKRKFSFERSRFATVMWGRKMDEWSDGWMVSLCSLTNECFLKNRRNSFLSLPSDGFSDTWMKITGFDLFAKAPNPFQVIGTGSNFWKNFARMSLILASSGGLREKGSWRVMCEGTFNACRLWNLSANSSLMVLTLSANVGGVKMPMKYRRFSSIFLKTASSN